MGDALFAFGLAVATLACVPGFAELVCRHIARKSR